MLINWIHHTKSESDFFDFWVQNHIFILWFSALTSQRLLCSQKTDVKCSNYSFLVYKTHFTQNHYEEIYLFLYSKVFFECLNFHLSNLQSVDRMYVKNVKNKQDCKITLSYDIGRNLCWIHKYILIINILDKIERETIVQKIADCDSSQLFP